MNNPHPPWHLIAKSAIRGTSLETLSRQFGLSVDSIREHLDRAIEHIPATQLTRVRTNSEIRSASERARNDLVSILQEAITELRDSDRPRLDQLSQFSALLNSAARLFSWPTYSVSRLSATQSAFNQSPLAYTVASVDHPQNGSDHSIPDQPGQAVNLALIATTPEQLARLAGRSPDNLPS